MDEVAKRLALHRLAIATNYLLPETDEARDLWFRVYLEGLASFSDETVVNVCRMLETRAQGGWFPKLPDLVEDMRAYVQRQRDQQKQPLQIQGKPVSAEKLAGFKAAVRAAIARKAMR